MLVACGSHSSAPTHVQATYAYTGPTTRIDWVALGKKISQARWYAAAASKPTPIKIVHAASVSRPSIAGSDRFDRLADCESGRNPTDLSPGGKYRGAFQFSLSTWHAAGMAGDPIDYSYTDQKAAAESWAQRSNPYGQWPVCWARTA